MPPSSFIALAHFPGLFFWPFALASVPLAFIGGGIFLSPLLLFMGWADTRTTAGVAAAFILVNSISGLLGYFSQAAVLPLYVPFLALAALIGGWVGATYGSRRFGHVTIRRLLAVVLVIAGLKMIFV